MRGVGGEREKERYRERERERESQSANPLSDNYNDKVVRERKRRGTNIRTEEETERQLYVERQRRKI